MYIGNKILLDMHKQESLLSEQSDKVEQFLRNPQNNNKSVDAIEAKLLQLYPYYVQYQNLTKGKQRGEK